MDKRPNVSRVDDIYIHAYYNHHDAVITKKAAKPLLFLDLVSLLFWDYHWQLGVIHSSQFFSKLSIWDSLFIFHK